VTSQRLELTAYEMMRIVRRSLFAVLLLIFSSSAIYAGSKSGNAKTVYDKAVQLEEDLKKSSKTLASLPLWKKTIDAYRSVFYKYPSSGYCDNALFHVASLYSQMAEQFKDNFYYHRATATYQFLIEQYPSSSLVEEAMLESIRIYRQLNKDEDAEAIASKLKRKSPKLASTVSQRATPSLSNPATLESLRHYTSDDYTRIVIDFDKEVSFKRERLSNPDRLYFDFDNTVAMKSLIVQDFKVDDGFLKQIRVGQNTYRKARVVLDLKSIDTYEVFSLYHPYRLVIDVQGTKTAAVPAPVATVLPEMMSIEPPEKNGNGKYSLARQLGLKVRRIIVDAGHGGHDPGAMAGRLKEKDITLDVAKRLQDILHTSYDFDVLMTRETDRYVPLEERTAFANSQSADLFVSVHVNSSRNRRARGIETYYLNFATTPEAMEIAARENAIAEKNMAELQKLTSAIALNSKIDESRDFASLVQTHLVSHLRKEYSVPSLGVKQAPFYVLIGAHMPAILAEISFISNEQESRLLNDLTYRQSIAEGLAAGVNRYIQSLAESRLTQNRN
jgi:N-acetylmuramoyl-L-alanine amidase